MASKTILVIPDQHAHPDHHNKRAIWLNAFMRQLRPDIVVNMGDAADMASLSSFDKGKRCAIDRSYGKDVDAAGDFQERLWHRAKAERTIILEGNHEHRIEKALDEAPELVGALSFDDLMYDAYYDEVVRYAGTLPGLIVVQGITFAHYMVSGIKGLPIGGENHARSLINKQHVSCVVAHSHCRDFAERTNGHGHRINGLVVGCYQDYWASWTGRQQQQLWWSGVVILRNAEGGQFDHQFVSLAVIRKEFGR